MASGGKNIIIEVMYRRTSFVSDTIQHFGIKLCAQVPHADDVEGRGQHDDEAHESEDAGALRGLSEDAKEYTKKLISQGWNTPKGLQREWVRRLSSQAGGGIPSVPDRSKLNISNRKLCHLVYFPFQAPGQSQSQLLALSHCNSMSKQRAAKVVVVNNFFCGGGTYGPLTAPTFA
jgi:hypothetical protein